jgi:hypothetical protein
MGQTFSLGRIFGIRVGVNWSVLVIVALPPRGTRWWSMWSPPC